MVIKMSKLTIRWLGQSGYILSGGGTVICIDPYLSDIVNEVAGRPRTREIPVRPGDLRADVLICTHNHLDHVDKGAIPFMKKDKMMFCAPSDCEETLKQLGVTHYTAFDEGAKVKAGGFEISAVFADHTVPAVGVLVKYEGKTLYFSGDTYYNKKLESIKCDFMFICINGKLGNMNADDAVKLTNIIKPKTAVPNHYDMFESNSENPEVYAKRVKNGFIMEFNREYEVSDTCLI